MIGKAGTLVLALVALVAVGPGGAPAQAAPDPYAPVVETEVEVDVRAKTFVGTRVVVRVRVEANSEDKPRGTVTITINRAPDRAGFGQGVATLAAAPVYTETVEYDGRPVRVEGPVVHEPGSYDVRAVFEPEPGSRWQGSSDTTTFTVVQRGPGASDAAADADDSTAPAGDSTGLLPGLPDTGGPHRWLLAFGLALVALGAAVVARARHVAFPRR